MGMDQQDQYLKSIVESLYRLSMAVEHMARGDNKKAEELAIQARNATSKVR